LALEGQGVTDEETKAVLLVEMRLAGVPHQVINYYRRYMFTTRYSNGERRYVAPEEAHAILERHLIGEDFQSWISLYGRYFEDADNLPVDESWTRGIT
jgi:hypothetical protein